MKRIILSAILLLSAVFATAADYQYGLRINTYPTSAKAHTGLLLEDGKAIETGGDRFRMEFELLNRSDNLLGTVFRIITDKGDNIDLMYTVDRNDYHSPILVTGEYVHEIRAALTTDVWLPVSIEIDPDDGEVSLDYAGTVLTVKDAGAKNAKNLRIAFGHCLIDGYALDDVASVSLRDIVLLRDNVRKRHWDLSIHDGDTCLDNLKGAPATAFNPSWLVDRYISWKDVCAYEFDKEPSIAFDPEGIFYLTADGQSIVLFDARDGSAELIGPVGGEYPVNAPSQLAWNGRLLAYNLDEGTDAVFDAGARRWEGGALPQRDHDYWNNAALGWEGGQAVVSFGGYGHYHYNNDLLIHRPGSAAPDRKYLIEEITPRYGSAIALLSDTLYILGGRGNLSGKQGLSPKAYKDLYALDLNTQEVVRLWEMPQLPETLWGEHMIYDPEEDCFYAFGSYEGGKLVKLKKDGSGYEEVSLSGDFLGDSQYVSFNLYLDAARTKLYATMIRSQVDGSSHVRIKSMDWPPVTMQLLHQSIVREERAEPQPDRRYWWLLPGALVLLLAGAWIGQRRRVGKKGEETRLELRPEVRHYDFSRNSICFFGGFNVHDRDGNDITPQFTPNLKALTILLLLHSAKDSVGIGSGKINRTLWSYKPEEAANNNRNVYLSKLRGLLESMDGVRIHNKNKLWSIGLSDGAQCDWLCVKELLSRKENEEGLDRILELLLKGAMLPDCEFDWLDSYKGNFSNDTINVLSKLLDADNISDELKIKAANTIFLHDFLNEDALRAKCRILYKQGKTGLAKSVYDNFCKDYLSSIGLKYEVGFKDLISG